MTIEKFTESMREILSDRAKERDMPEGESLMGSIVHAFHTVTGHALSVKDGYVFMICLKLVRMNRKFKPDDALDLANYAALLAADMED
jgi:hypothetical protein